MYFQMVNRFNVFLGHKKKMQRGFGMNIMEGHELLILVLYSRRRLLFYDFTENTICHRYCHFFNLFLTSSTTFSSFTVSCVPFAISRTTMVLSKTSRWPKISVNSAPSLSARASCARR